MFIAKKADGGLCFSCDECSWTCDSAESLGDFSRGYEGFQLSLEAPTIEEIEAAGWLKYCKYSE